MLDETPQVYYSIISGKSLALCYFNEYNVLIGLDGYKFMLGFKGPEYPFWF